DLDPQNSLTSYFSGYISNIEKYNAYSMLKGDFHFNECICKINDYISIIPSHPILGKFNSESIDYKEIILEHHLNE
ncbi:ParA family protein, partial [Borreliella garinii]